MGDRPRKNMAEFQVRPHRWVSLPLGRDEKGKNGRKTRRVVENGGVQLRLNYLRDLVLAAIQSPLYRAFCRC